MSTRKSILQGLAVSAALFASHAAFAQVTPATATVQLNAKMGESITISVSTPTLNFTLVPGAVSSGAAPTVGITTTWALNTGHANVVVAGSLASTTSALNSGTNLIPASAVFGQSAATGGPTVMTPFTQTVTGVAGATAGASLQILKLPLTAANLVGTRTDNLSMQIDLTGLTTLPVANYTGTMTLIATAI